MSEENVTFQFTNADGNLLTTKDRIKMIGDLNEGVEITINLNVLNYNLPTVNPVIFLQPATDYGEVDYPSLQSPYSDYQDLLLWGSNTESPAGLYIRAPDLNEDPELVSIHQRQKIYFGYSQGANIGNGIELLNVKNISIPGLYQYKIGFTNNSNLETRRFHIGLNVIDRGYQ